MIEKKNGESEREQWVIYDAIASQGNWRVKLSASLRRELMATISVLVSVFREIKLWII